MRKLLSERSQLTDLNMIMAVNFDNKFRDFWIIGPKRVIKPESVIVVGNRPVNCGHISSIAFIYQ